MCPSYRFGGSVPRAEGPVEEGKPGVRGARPSGPTALTASASQDDAGIEPTGYAGRDGRAEQRRPTSRETHRRQDGSVGRTREAYSVGSSTEKEEPSCSLGSATGLCSKALT